jgi:copper chaperone CopZ
VHTIQSEISDLDGVKSVVATQDTRQTTIVFDAPATEEKIKDLLALINYPVAG